LPARILIVDDNSIARTTIRGLLDWHSFQICGEAQDGRDAITKVTELRPDIVILDINMPGMNGINAAYEIRRISPSTKIVFLTIHDTPAARHNTRLWSHGFVSKSAAGTELIPILTRLAGEIAPIKRAKSRRATIVKPPRSTD
jgi:YesN/AraC family two-component response regulator